MRMRRTGPRIAILGHAHPSVSKGGAELAAYTLYLALQQLGLPVIFIAACAEVDLPRLQLASAEEHIIAHDPALFDAHLLLGMPGAARALLRILHEQRIALVNFHHYLNLGLGALRAVLQQAGPSQTGLPVVLSLHEYLAICAHHGQMVTRPDRQLCQQASDAGCATCFPEHGLAGMQMRRRHIQALFAMVDAFVSPSRFLIARHIDWGLPADRLHLIPNGLPAHRFPDPALAVIGAPPRPLTFGYFGQINPFKGVDLLLDAADLLAQDPALIGRFALQLHGNRNGLSAAFEARLQAALQRHSFLTAPGAYDNATVLQLMRGCDQVLVPSRWWENAPMVIQEAFAAGRPVICPGIGGMAEMVQDGISGHHFRANDAADLARLLRRLILSGSTGPWELPKVPTARDMARSYLSLFQSCLSGRDAPAEPPAGRLFGRMALNAGSDRPR